MKACPRCKGDLYEEVREYGPVYQCLQCGHEVTVLRGLDGKRFTSVVARHCGVSPADLLGRSRNTRVALARQVLMYLLIEKNGWKLREVGYLLKRTPSTVIWGCRSIADKLHSDTRLIVMMDGILEELGYGDD